MKTRLRVDRFMKSFPLFDKITHGKAAENCCKSYARAHRLEPARKTRFYKTPLVALTDSPRLTPDPLLRWSIQSVGDQSAAGAILAVTQLQLPRIRVSRASRRRARNRHGRGPRIVGEPFRQIGDVRSYEFVL
jgi:hypothetical protein